MTKDIEREAFEALQSPIIFERIIYLETENLYIAKEAFQFDIFTATKCNELNFGWVMWQAAKAHEAEKLKGKVVVPVQCPDPDFADSLFDELSKKAIGEFGDDLLIHFSDIDEEKIWALMVEAAQESTND